MHILPNISRIKDNQTLEFGQVIEYNDKNIFLQNPEKLGDRETSSRPLFVFLKTVLDQVKASDLQLSFNMEV